MLRKHVLHLLAPAPAAAEETATGMDAPPPGPSSDWMSGFREEFKAGAEPEPPAKGKEPDGKTDADAGSTKPPVAGLVAKPDPAAAAPAGKAGAKSSDGAVDPKAAPADPKDQAAYEAELDAKTWPKDKSDWEKHKDAHKQKMRGLRTEIETRDKTLTELQSKLADFETKLQAKPVVDPDIEKKVKFLESKNAEYHNALLEAGVLLHPDFKSHFSTRTNDIVSDALSAVPQDKSEQLKKLLEMPEGDYKRAQLDEFMSDVDDHAKTEIYVAMRDLRKLGKERDAEIAKAKETADGFAKQREAKVAAYRANSEKAFQDTVKAITDPKSGMVVYQKRDGDDAWNAAVDKRLAEAKDMAFSAKMTPGQVARAVLDAKALPVVLEAYQADLATWNEEKAKFEAQIKDLTVAQPNGGTGIKPPGGDEKDPLDDPSLPPWERSRLFAQAMTKLIKTPIEQ